jgi:hypothetical protein
MDTAAAFRRHGFSASLSFSYETVEGGPHREIDVFAWKQQSFEGIDFRVNLMVECKSSRKNPWVTFSQEMSGPLRATDLAFSALSPKLFPFFIRQLARRRPEVASTALFGPVDRIAHGARSAFSDQDLAYQALMSSVTASLAALSRTANELETDNYPVIELTLPVVVIDNALLDYVLKIDGRHEMIRRDSMIVSAPVPGKLQAVLVHVVTAPALENWVNGVRESMDVILVDCTAELNAVVDRWAGAPLRTK